MNTRNRDKRAGSRPVGREGDVCEGFRIIRIVPLPALRATACEAQHLASGARLLHLHAPEDHENGFAITFPTPPPDDSGVAHILEHAVLGGSRRFPVREPFFEMVKMSLATFINAMTSQTYTVYPVASPVKKDFFNLAEVYLDAVFHPLLTEDLFRREGHHLAPADPSDPASPLVYSGIVYSEMLGVGSIPEERMEQRMVQHLFPGTPQGRNAGGDPDHIPGLTFERFRKFHADHYQPGNALVFLFGDIPTAEHLRFLNPRLREAGRGDPVAPLPRVARWKTPRRVEEPYPVSAGEDLAEKTFLMLGWRVGDALDPDLVTAWQVLDALLLGHEAAPLRKALVDSGLGADLFGERAECHACELGFLVGLKGSEADRAGAFEETVLGTLGTLAGTPFASEAVEAAFQQVAYDTLEVKSLFPLHQLFAVNAAWPYGGDPLTFLDGRQRLERCRERYRRDAHYFSRLLRQGLLDNPHRLRMVLRPDPGEASRIETERSTRLEAVRARLSRSDIEVLARKAAELAATQSTPNPPEAVASLPQLALADLPPRLRKLPTVQDEIAGVTVLRNEVFSNGVNYIEWDMDLSGLPADLYRWLPLYHEAVAKMGAAGQDYSTLAARRAACTGGLGSRTLLARHVGDPDQMLRTCRFGMKALDAEADKALALLGDLVFEVDPDDRTRLRDVLSQTRAGYRTALVSNGLDTALHEAARGLHPVGALRHLMFSPETLRFIENQCGDFDACAGPLIGQVTRVREYLAHHARWTVSFTGSEAVFRRLTRMLEEWAGRRQAAPLPEIDTPFVADSVPRRMGLAGPFDAAHCAYVMPAPHLGHPAAPSIRLAAYLSVFDILLPEIRFKGKAYGAGMRHDDALGMLVMTSFSDPSIVTTLDVFERLRERVSALRWSREDVHRAVIGCAREAVQPIRPAETTALALTRYGRGDLEALREARYAAILRATADSLRAALLDTLEANAPQAALCVAARREQLEAANRSLGARALDISDLFAPAGASLCGGQVRNDERSQPSVQFSAKLTL